jgi:HSP20 family protein
MSLIKRNQNDKSVQNLRSDFDSLFDNFFGDFPIGFSSNSNLVETSFKPKVNISEDEKSYQIDAELPGVKKEDIEVEYANDLLTIKAEKKEETEDKDKNYHKVESFYGTFSRSIQIPNVDYDNVKAKFTDGVLKIELPKAEEDKTKSKISIE